ncbi:MAG: Ribonuclease HII [Promethearchaeota archaeon]|nr:MAG: Ribonuclease HII [Candidatus Lokiarchaeota archaeon]
MKNPLICGLDEAGRGPVLGPLVLCGVCFLEEDLGYLQQIGVKDSKKVSAQKRETLARQIKANCSSYKVLQLTPQDIDNREKTRTSLNTLEVIKFAEILNELQPAIIYIDAADTDEKRFGRILKKQLNFSPHHIISKHKADTLYPVVGAASIIAKTYRDKIIDELKLFYQDYGYIDIGSGYPSDEKTINFLRNWIQTNKKPPSCARKTWATTKTILNEEVSQEKITKYFK